MKPSIVRVHIRELVLEGVAARDRRHVGEAIRLELARLLSQQTPSAFVASGRIVDGGAFTFSGTRTLGRQVARRLHRGLQR